MEKTAAYKPLQIAVVHDGPELGVWEREILDSLLAIRGVELLALISVPHCTKNSMAEASGKSSIWQAEKIQSLVSTNGQWQLTAKDRDFLSESSVDVVLNLSGKEPRGSLYNLARLGTWVFRLGDQLSSGLDDFGKAELAADSEIQTVSLQRLTDERGHGQVLKFGKLKAVRYSLKNHRSKIIATIKGWPSSVVKLVLSNNGEILAVNSDHAFQIRPHSDFGPREEVALAFKLSYRQCERFLSRLRRLFIFQQWNIGIIAEPAASFLSPFSNLQVQWMQSPSWPIYLADPFPVMRNGELSVLAERFDFERNQGDIVAFKLSREGHLVAGQTAMNLDSHISYPFSFEHEGRTFCIPENLESNAIVIYEAISFPNQWRPVVTVTRGARFADPTIFQHEGRWWIFATQYNAWTEGNEQLFAWYADSLNGPWSPHLANPIKSDVSSSRSAGIPFQSRGETYRPAQDCARQYGAAVVINRIKTLTPLEFQEDAVVKVLPDRLMPDGFHHFASHGNITLVDGRREVFFPKAIFSKVKHKLSAWVRQWLYGSKEAFGGTSPVAGLNELSPSEKSDVNLIYVR